MYNVKTDVAENFKDKPTKKHYSLDRIGLQVGPEKFVVEKVEGKKLHVLCTESKIETIDIFDQYQQATGAVGIKNRLNFKKINK